MIGRLVEALIGDFEEAAVVTIPRASFLLPHFPIRKALVVEF